MPTVPIYVDASVYQLTAWFGDAYHKIALVEIFGDVSKASDYWTNTAQADYLRNCAPQLVPRPENGVPPSEHTISQAFEYHYCANIPFRVRYLSFIRSETSDFEGVTIESLPSYASDV